MPLIGNVWYIGETPTMFDDGEKWVDLHPGATTMPESVSEDDLRVLEAHWHAWLRAHAEMERAWRDVVATANFRDPSTPEWSQRLRALGAYKQALAVEAASRVEYTLLATEIDRKEGRH